MSLNPLGLQVQLPDAMGVVHAVSLATAEHMRVAAPGLLVSATKVLFIHVTLSLLVDCDIMRVAACVLP